MIRASLPETALVAVYENGTRLVMWNVGVFPNDRAVAEDPEIFGDCGGAWHCGRVVGRAVEGMVVE